MFTKHFLIKEMSYEKRSQEIEQLIAENVETSRDLLTPREFHTFRDKSGNNLLQLAILQNKRRIFNYILSLKTFPLNSVNHRFETALMTSLREYRLYFSHRLIAKGVRLDFVYPNGDTILIKALKKCPEEICIQLIRKGVDVNAPDSQGRRPLFYALRKSDELVSALLCHGAWCDVSDFANAAVHKRGHLLADYVFDAYTEPVEVNLSVLLKLATLENLAMFERVIGHVKGVVVDCLLDFYDFLVLVDYHILRLVLEKYDFLLKMLLYNLEPFVVSNNIDLEKFDAVLSSRLGCDFVAYMEQDPPFWPDSYFIYFGRETETTHMFCLLLSYGLQVRESYLDQVYQMFGFCDLFRILLHMDHPFSCEIHGVASVFYDVSTDLQEYLQDLPLDLDEMDYFLKHSAHPYLKDVCEYDGDDLPKVPLLVELARNSVRKFIVDTFEVANFRQLERVLAKLPICKLHRKIITLEHTLY